MEFYVNPVGIIRSVFKSRDECPKQPHNDIKPSHMIVYGEYIEGLSGLEVGDEIYVFTWLHRADRGVIRCHPRGDVTRPKRGVFATRSPDRPNPIGIHRVRILNIEGNVIVIHPIEVIDNTPVIDIKPVDFLVWKESFGPYVDPRVAEEMKRIGERAWMRGLISGFNGNISVRVEDRVMITNTGINKGMILPGDIAVYDMVKDKFLYGSPSSEWRMHLGIYKNQEMARAILHTHPVYVIAAVEKMGNFLERIDVFEKEMFLNRMEILPPLVPGSKELSDMVSKLSSNKEIIVLKRHGIVCWGESLSSCLSLSEEVEKLAEISLLWD